MYAIIKTGSKQYRVTEGQTLKIEKLEQDIGQFVKFNDVLMISTSDELYIGTPFIKEGEVIGKVVDQGRRSKISIVKFKRRKHHLKCLGHRQDFTEVKITEILLLKQNNIIGKKDGA